MQIWRRSIKRLTAMGLALGQKKHTTGLEAKRRWELNGILCKPSAIGIDVNLINSIQRTSLEKDCIILLFYEEKVPTDGYCL